MVIFARPIHQLVKPEFVEEVHNRLLRNLFANIRLAIVGLVSAMLLYYAMLMRDDGIDKHLFWFFAEFAFAIPIILFYFIGEEWIKNTHVRLRTANVTAFLVAALIGVGFVFQLPYIKDANIKLTAFSLIIGVTGAAAFTFACNRFTFILFSIPWLAPVAVYLFFVASDLGSIALASMVIPYLGVLTFLCLKDYERRVELIRSQLSLIEEKEQIVLASEKLQASLDLVNELKTQQDGDYYLTSLLLNPLGVNAVDEGLNVDVDFFTKQKKVFEFRNQRKSIGGDISIAHTMEFSTGSVTIFLNADAMGKSMQGAGGSLVLGAVFQAIIERTRKRKSNEPVSWIQNTFLELQKVFESFDCSMLVSIYIAVLENNTGKLFYLNAEHPWGVLYRGGKAVFLQNRSYYRKLGTPGLQDEIFVDQIQLEDKDIIFLGSDGRDDIALASTEAGVRVINEDETVFLRHIEIAEGRLNPIYDLIAASGTITDDLSLVRVQFNATTADAAKEAITASVLLRDAKRAIDQGDSKNARDLLSQAQNSSTAGPRALRAALNLAMQIKEYDLALAIADKHTALHAGDSEVFFLAAYAAHKLKKTQRAKEALDEVLNSDPENSRALRLREELLSEQ